MTDEKDTEAILKETEFADALDGLTGQQLAKIAAIHLGRADVIYFLIDTLDSDTLREAIAEVEDVRTG